MERLIQFEDEHLLVVNKPAGINTHCSGQYAGEGIYEWLRRREPRWADLAIMQRLDKETSGVLLFSKTARGNVSLSKQFARRGVNKAYQLLTDRRPPGEEWIARSRISKGHCRFESRSVADDAEGLEAETRFVVEAEVPEGWRVLAEPRTGRTHQIRLHAADHGIPILGDVTYGGTAWHRLALHARMLQLHHPASNEPVEFLVESDFGRRRGDALRSAFIDPRETDAFRVVHGASDGRPGAYVERLGRQMLISSADGDHPMDAGVPDWLMELVVRHGCEGLHERRLDRQVRGAAPGEASPRRCWGESPTGLFEVRENSLRYGLSFAEGYSCGLFLDQRDNRRRLTVNWIGPEFPVREGGLGGAEVLNVFAYTCGFSVAAAAGGARTTSLDLSRKYLDWGRGNFAANGFDAAGHDFIFGDAFDWLKRLAKKGRLFDVVLLDPPTFSQSKEHGVFRAESDYDALVALAVKVLRPGGVLMASTNAAKLEAWVFMDLVRAGLAESGRPIVRELFVPQPPDFPTSREEPGYLKTVWLKVG